MLHAFDWKRSWGRAGPVDTKPPQHVCVLALCSGRPEIYHLNEQLRMTVEAMNKTDLKSNSVISTVIEQDEDDSSLAPLAIDEIAEGIEVIVSGLDV